MWFRALIFELWRIGSTAQRWLPFCKKEQQDSALYAGKISGSDRIREVVDVTGTLK